MSMKRIVVTIKGLSPLLMNSFPAVARENEKLDSAQDQAEHRAYRDSKGDLCIPGLNFQRALVAGAAFSKGSGRASLQKVVAAGLFVNTPEASLGTKTFEVAQHRVVIAATRGAILRYRPRVNDWKATFELDYDNTLLNSTKVKKIIEDTGARVGLLDFRPEKKGPFGRFEVMKFAESE